LIDLSPYCFYQLPFIRKIFPHHFKIDNREAGQCIKEVLLAAAFHQKTKKLAAWICGLVCWRTANQQNL